MIAWFGSFLLGICGFPELIRTVRDKRCHVGWGMLLTWYFGELLVAYHVFTTLKDYALLTNYAFNIIIISVMLFYKIKSLTSKKHLIK